MCGKGRGWQGGARFPAEFPTIFPARFPAAFPTRFLARISHAWQRGACVARGWQGGALQGVMCNGGMHGRRDFPATISHKIFSQQFPTRFPTEFPTIFQTRFPATISHAWQRGACVARGWQGGTLQGVMCNGGMHDRRDFPATISHKISYRISHKISRSISHKISCKNFPCMAKGDVCGRGHVWQGGGGGTWQGVMCSGGMRGRRDGLCSRGQIGGLLRLEVTFLSGLF